MILNKVQSYKKCSWQPYRDTCHWDKHLRITLLKKKKKKYPGCQKVRFILEKCLLISRITKDDLYDIHCGKEIFQKSERKHKIIRKKSTMQWDYLSILKNGQLAIWGMNEKGKMLGKKKAPENNIKRKNHEKNGLHDHSQTRSKRTIKKGDEFPHSVPGHFWSIGVFMASITLVTEMIPFVGCCLSSI